MKKLLFILIMLPALLRAQVSDTTYKLSVVPPTDPHNVLVEQFTGPACASASIATNVLDTIASTQAPGRINVINLYTYGIPQTIPLMGSAHDLRDTAATIVADSVYGGISTLPLAGIDRAPLSGNLLFTSPTYSTEINTRLAVADSLNLDISSIYNTSTGKVTITTQVIYTQAVSTHLSISVAIVEDSIIDMQEKLSATIDSFYQFDNVFRGFVTTSPFGDPILFWPTTPGWVYQSKYTFIPKSSWVLSHCKAVAFVTDTGTTPTYVRQSAQTPLARHTTSVIGNITRQATNIYPNPAHTQLTIQSDQPINEITITDLLGQTVRNMATQQRDYVRVDVADLPTGVYLVRINGIEVRKFVKE